MADARIRPHEFRPVFNIIICHRQQISNGFPHFSQQQQLTDDYLEISEVGSILEF